MILEIHLKTMILTKLFILLSRGKDLFIKNISLHLVSMVTIATVLFVFNIFLMIGYSADTFVKSFSNIQTVRVYLNTNDQTAINDLNNKILDMKAVEKIQYFSPQDTYDHLKQSQFNEKYLKVIPVDFFPEFIEVTINEKYRDIAYIKDIEAQLSSFKIVDVASFGESWILNFISFRYGIQLFLTILAILLLIAMCSIIYNTVKISLFRYKEQIKIYNLVGATKSFIILPFIATIVIEITISYFTAMFLGILIFQTMNSLILETININFLIVPSYYLYIVCYFLILLVSVLAGQLSVNSFLNKMGTINES